MEEETKEEKEALPDNTAPCEPVDKAAEEAVTETSPAAAADDDKMTAATDPLAAAEAEIAALNDKYLRKAAELENYRKRTIKEKADLIVNGGEKVVTALLPVLDDIERAMKNSQDTASPDVLKEGMALIYNKFVKTLATLGVTQIDTSDADFDTDLHEAIALVPGMGDEKKGKVIDCVQTGYKMNDKVIRHAKVAVGQ